MRFSWVMGIILVLASINKNTMTQELYQKAIKFSGEKHSEHKVPGTNSNYLVHVSNVVMEVLIAYNHDNSFDLNLAMQIAILHDTIEDTDATYEEINEVFGMSIAKGVKALTKNERLTSKEEKMLDSLNRINKLSDEIGIVKIADRITNLQAPPEHWTTEKIIKYCEEAKLIAIKLTGKNTYLNQRLLAKIKEYEERIINNI